MVFNQQGFGQQQPGGGLEDIFGGGGGFPGGDSQQDAFMQLLSSALKEGRISQFNQDDFLDEEDELGFGPPGQPQGGGSQQSFGIGPGSLFNNISALMSLFGQGGGQ